MSAYTLEDKIGQMVLVGFRGARLDRDSPIARDVRAGRVGGVVLTDSLEPPEEIDGNIESPEQLARLNADLQRVSPIPLLVAIDAEGGQIIRLKERYGFPPTKSAFELGHADNLDATRANGALIAGMLKNVGANVNFAPVVDLNKRPDNRALGVKRRVFSADAETVIRHATAFIEEQHREGIACSIKHFPGHGSASGDSHLGMVDVTDTWGEDELEPFRRLIAAGLADSVMTAHVFHRAFDTERPATLSAPIITGLLRGRLSFGGVVFSDDLSMGAVLHHYGYEEAILWAVEAGVDVMLNANVTPYDELAAEKTFAALLDHVKSGRLSERRIDESFERIMALKGRYAVG